MLWRGSHAHADCRRTGRRRRAAVGPVVGGGGVCALGCGHSSSCRALEQCSGRGGGASASVRRVRSGCSDVAGDGGVEPDWGGTGPVCARRGPVHGALLRLGYLDDERVHGDELRTPGQSRCPPHRHEPRHDGAVQNGTDGLESQAGLWRALLHEQRRGAREQASIAQSRQVQRREPAPARARQGQHAGEGSLHAHPSQEQLNRDEVNALDIPHVLVEGGQVCQQPQQRACGAALAPRPPALEESQLRCSAGHVPCRHAHSLGELAFVLPLAEVQGNRRDFGQRARRQELLRAQQARPHGPPQRRVDLSPVALDRLQHQRLAPVCVESCIGKQRGESPRPLVVLGKRWRHVERQRGPR
mmetsp:Transcript_7240/g.29070  ORF Transcript_7240/g.29070 Transcript_7240/m.29070 type:complete len:358 (-) Transcript_7240:48-1121(-)